MDKIDPVSTPVPPEKTINKFLSKFKRVSSNFKTLPVGTKKLLSLGMVVALLVALPVVVMTVVTSRTFFFNRAATGETIEPPPTSPPLTTIVITTDSFIDGVVGQSYRNFFYAEFPPSTIDPYLTATNLPSGLSVPRSLCSKPYYPINSPNMKMECALDGIPEKGGRYFVKIVASAGQGNSVSKDATLMILNSSPTPTPRTPSPTPGTPTPTPRTPTPPPYVDCYSCNSSNQCVFDAGCYMPGPRCSLSNPCPTPTPRTPSPTPRTPGPWTPAPTPNPYVKPVISTSSIPTGRSNKYYSASISGYEKISNTRLSMSILGLPKGLSTTCISGNNIGGSMTTISCYIKGTPLSWGIFRIPVTLYDSRQQSVSKTFSLIIYPF